MIWNTRRVSVVGSLEYRCSACHQNSRHTILRQRRYLTFPFLICFPILPLGLGIFTSQCQHCKGQEAVPVRLRRQMLRLFRR